MKYASNIWLILLTTLLTFSINLGEEIWSTAGLYSPKINPNQNKLIVKAMEPTNQQQTPPPPEQNTPEATPQIQPQVSSIGIILGAIIAVLIVIGGVIWHGVTNPKLRR